MENTLLNTWFIIANPTAGKNAVVRRWRALQAFLQSHLPDHIAVLTTHRAHATELAQQAIRQGYRKIIALGGDGTNFEVINGILSQKEVPATEITYALLPIGTGNDWIRTHGIPKDWQRWLQMVQNGKTLWQDVGVVDYQENGEVARRYFVNVAGMAYDAFVVRYAAQYKRWVVHKILYLFMVLRCLFKYRLTRARVAFAGQTVEDYFYTINIGICRYSGGGMRLVPHADPADGQLALTLARRVSKLGVLLNTYRFYNGTLGEHPQIDLYQTVSVQVQPLEGAEALWVEADGEFLGDAPARFSILPAALQIIVP